MLHYILLFANLYSYPLVLILFVYQFLLPLFQEHHLLLTLKFRWAQVVLFAFVTYLILVFVHYLVWNSHCLFFVLIHGILKFHHVFSVYYYIHVIRAIVSIWYYVWKLTLVLQLSIVVFEVLHLTLKLSGEHALIYLNWLLFLQLILLQILLNLWQLRHALHVILYQILNISRIINHAWLRVLVYLLLRIPW